MLIELSDRTRDLLMQSLPLMEHGKGALIDRLGRYMSSDVGEAGQDSELVAIVLADLLLTQASHLVRFGTLQDVEDVGLEHSRLNLQGRHYSRFGDALAPVIRDVLGPKVPGEVGGAWGDVFWAIIRAVQDHDGNSGIAPHLARPVAPAEMLHPT